MSILEDGLFGGGNVPPNNGTPAGPNQINGGAITDSAASILMKNFSSAFVGPNWTALLNALGTGDQYVASNNEAIFDQAFLASASFPYLIDRASDIGITYPTNVGLNENTFRQFALNINANKITNNALLNILNTFYGDYLTRASLTSDNYQPYSLYYQTNPSISFIIDGQLVNVQFFQSDFTTNGAVSAEDLAQAINRYFTYNNLPATAGSYYNPENGQIYLRIYSGSIGLAGNIACVGGSAQDVIKFPQFLPDDADNTTTWSVSYSPVTSGNARYSYDTGTNPDVWSVARIGDYVNIFAPFGNTQAFASSNQGTFKIVSVGVNYFEVYNPQMTPQVGVAANPSMHIVNTINFYRPVKFTVFSNPIYATLDLSTKNVLRAYLPALSPIVERNRPLGSYFVTPTQTTVASTAWNTMFITSLTVNIGSTVTLNASASIPSTVSIGQYVFLESSGIVVSGANNPIGDGLYGAISSIGSSSITVPYSGSVPVGSYSCDLVAVTTNIGRDASGNVWLNVSPNASLFAINNWLILDGAIPDNSNNVGTLSGHPVCSVSAGRINHNYQINSISGNIVKLTTRETKEMTASNGASIMFMAAPLEIGIPGPYMYDTNIDLANISAPITNISTTVLQELRKGFSYTMVPVADPSQFPNTPGYLVFNFGSPNQVAFVPYIGSFTNISGGGGYLLFNATYIFPADVANGSTVIYSGTQTGAFVPSNPPALSTLYLTDSPAGRAAAEDAILSNGAAGFLKEIYIKWPVIFGVGNWAYPFELSQPALGGGGKINDAVRIWAENITDDVNNALNFTAPDQIESVI